MLLLIVDDEPKLLDLLSRYMGRLGYQVETSGDAEDALALFQAGPDRFSMAITDLSLPTMNGEELIERMRQLRSGLPAIVTSGYPYVPRPAGIGFLQKPFLPQMLLRRSKKRLKVRPNSVRTDPAYGTCPRDTRALRLVNDQRHARRRWPGRRTSRTAA